MITKTKAIVLHSIKYGESKIIVDLLTESCGRISCIATLSKSNKGKLKKQYFQPLTILEVVTATKPHVQLAQLKEARVDIPFVSIPFNPYKLSIALFTAEFLRLSTKNELPDALIFNYALNSIAWLDSCMGSFANFHLVFMMRLSRFLGFYPNMDNHRQGDWFDLRAGCFCRQPPLHSDVLPPAEAEHIQLLLRMNFSTMHLFRMARHDRNRMAETILQYYRLHLPGFADMKSFAVLKELF